MTNSPFVRSALAHRALEFTPPLIREILLEKRIFREEYGINLDATILLDNATISVKRSGLFDAVRKVLSGTPAQEVSDMDGRKWILENISREGELPSLAFSCDEKHFYLPAFVVLSPDSSIRLRYFEEAASDVNLPSKIREAWVAILTERALEDDEVDELHNEFRNTPISKARFLHGEIEKGRSSISTLVPPSRRYFERFIGVYDGSTSITDYAASCGKKLFDQLLTWRPYEGFLFSLFLSSHSSLTAEIDTDVLTDDDLLRAFEFLVSHGDRISQLGAIEVGFRILPARPKIQPSLVSLIEQIRDDDVGGQASDFKLLSALFILVDGELSRIRLFSKEPPYYRRLAALSQAALIHRQLMNSGADLEQFCDWAMGSRGQQFCMQTLADMRLEPRWNPELAYVLQLKAEFISRIIMGAKKFERNIEDSSLSNLVLGDNPNILRSQPNLISLYLPGPLEGTQKPQVILPKEITEIISANLSTEQVGPSSFIALVNSALIFPLGKEQASMAAKALKLGRYRLACVEDRQQLFTILNGLATAAAVTRSKELASELRILVRRYRNDVQFTLSIQEALNICLVAAASHVNLTDWRDFAGDWLTELAFSELEGDEGEVLYSALQYLLRIVPNLWVSCGRADAALKAYNAVDTRAGEIVN